MRNAIDISDLIGKPFRDGARGPDAYDCFGLVLEVLRRHGCVIPDYGAACGLDAAAIHAAMLAAEETRLWERLDGPEPGALVAVCYPLPGWITHCGVAVGEGKFIHARRATGGVTLDRLQSPAWRRRIHGFYRWAGGEARLPVPVPREILRPLSGAETVRDVVQMFHPGLPPDVCIVIHNSRIAADWSRPVRSGDHLAIVPRLAGGGGDFGSTLVRIVATVAIAAAAVATGQYVAGYFAAGSFLGTMAGVSSATGVMVAGSLVVNSLLPSFDPVSAPLLSGLPASSGLGATRTYGWGGPALSWSPDLAIPILYGKMRVGGQVINYYLDTNNSTDDQTVHILIGVCEGKVATPPASADDIYVNDEKLSFFDEYSYDTRVGEAGQDVIGGFGQLHQYRQYSIKVATRCVMMLHFNEATPFVDTSPVGATVNTSGSVTRDTVNKKYGASSGLFDGASYLNMLDDARYVIGDRNCCMGCWCKLTNDARQYHGLLEHGDNSEGWSLYYDATNDIIGFTVFGAVGSCNSGQLSGWPNIDMFDGGWHYVEFNRVGLKQGIWVDGYEVGGGSNDWTYGDYAATLNVGRSYVGGGYQYAKGNIDDAFFFVSVALHQPSNWGSWGGTLNFTPPGEIPDDFDYVVATKGECDEINVLVEFPNGLYEVNAGSELVDHDCEFAIHYRVVGVTAWTHHGDFTVTAAKREAVRRQYTITSLARNRYEVKLQRISAEETDTLHMSDLYWTAIDEILDEELAYPYLAILGVHILASARLSGRSPEISSVWDRGTITVKGSVSSGAFIDTGTMNVASSNPAWAAYDLLTNERYGGKIAPSRLDYASWDAWADWCDGTVDGVTRITLNGILDSQMSLASALNKICQHGRARLVPAGQTIRVAVEMPVSTPEQVFGAGNVLEGSSATEFIPRRERPDMYYIEIQNAADDYRRAKIPVKSAGYAALTRAPITESIMLWGCTSEVEARRYGLLRMQISDRLNRMKSVKADVEAIACLPGDMIVIQDDGNSLTFGGRLGDQTGVASGSVKLDQAITLDTATYSGNCTIWVRLADDSLESRSVTGPFDTVTDTFTLDSAIAGAAREDVFVIGRATGEAVKYRAMNIARDSDCLFDLTAIEYDSTVYYHSDYDSGGTAI